MSPPVCPLFTKTTLSRPPVAAARALGKERMGVGLPMPYSEGGMKKFFAYVMKNICHSQRRLEPEARYQPTKIMGAQKARTLVKNHCRHATMSSVFFVRIHVWLRIAMVCVVAHLGAFEVGISIATGSTVRPEMCRYYRLRDGSGSHACTLQGYQAESTATQMRGVNRSCPSGERNAQRPTSEDCVRHTQTTAKRRRLVVVFICLPPCPRLGMVLRVHVLPAS